MNKLYALLFLFGLCTLPVLPARAQEAPPETETIPEIFISEINWAGSSSSTADEWIELFNSTSESVDIGGWILTGAATSGDALAIEAETLIGPLDTLLISNYSIDHEKTTLNVLPDLVTSSLSLPNSGLNIMLTTPEGVVIDEVASDDRAGGTEPVASMNRENNMMWGASNTSVNLLDQEQFGTPGVHTFEILEEDITEEGETPEEPDLDSDGESEETPSSTHDCEFTKENIETVEEEQTEPETEQETENTPLSEGDLILNEIVSDPTDGIEWVEIVNATESTIELVGFGVMEGSGKLTLIPDIELAPGEFFVVEDPAGNLNNDGDSVYLFEPSGTILDEMAYGTDKIPSPKKGESLVLMEGTWMISTTITKGEENTLPEPDLTEENEYDDSQTNDQPSDSQEDEPDSLPPDSEESTETDTELSDSDPVHKVVAIASEVGLEHASEKSALKSSKEKSSSETTIVGAMTALPGTFGKQIAFIEGTQIYFHHADWPELQIGDLLSITGEPSTSRGESRLKISSVEDIKVLNNTEVVPETATATSLATLSPGSLVSISGEVVERDGDKLMLQDETGEVLVVAHKNTNIQFSEITGTNVKITGVIRDFDGTIKLYPRSQSDIEPEEQDQSSFEDVLAPAATSGVATPWIGGGLLAGALTALAYWYIKAKRPFKATKFKLATTI